MIAFLQQIANIIVSVISFVVHALQMLVEIILTIPRVLLYVIQCIGYLPPFVNAIVIVSISVSVVLFILNKGSD